MRLLKLKLRSEDGATDVGSLLMMRVPRNAAAAKASAAGEAAAEGAAGGAAGARPGASRTEWRRRESEMLMEVLERSRLEYLEKHGEGGKGGEGSSPYLRSRRDQRPSCRSHTGRT